MLNQVSVEAVYSATYVENYLDCVENLPDELQRLISRMRELDVYYIAQLREFTLQTENLRNISNDLPSKRAKRFLRMQQALIAAQELGDEKMHLLQVLLDKIEIKTRLLDQDYKNLDFGKEEQSPVEVKEPSVPTTPVAANNNITSSNIISTPSSERPNKRARRARNDTFNENTNPEPVPAEHSLRSQETKQTPPVAVASTSQKKTSTGKKKKRKARQAAAAATAATTPREESPPRDEEPLIDPDEPTYCLCDQISYGEMIMCDNDLCPIEWFHFSCVTLTTKPKGKWYCPKCRGDRTNVMKPKAQFLRELEKYNKEKEEKT